MDELSQSNGAAPRTAGAEHDQAIQQIRAALRDLKFGVISVVVQDGVVIQIEKTEKYRLRRSEAPVASNGRPAK